MAIWNKQKRSKGLINVNESYEGIRIEQKIANLIANKEPITDGAPIIFTERKDGVLAAYNVRTDRFDFALDAMDKVVQGKIAQREEKSENIGKPEPTQGEVSAGATDTTK